MRPDPGLVGPAGQTTLGQRASGEIWRSGLSIADQALVSACSLVTAIAVGRFAGPAELARYSLALSVVTALCVVQESLVSAPLNVYVSRTPETERRAIVGRALYLAAVLATAATLLAAVTWLVGQRFAAASLPPDIAALVGCSTLALLLRDFARRASAARLDMAAVLRLDTVVACVQMGALGVFALAGDLSVGRAFLILSVASGTGVAYWVRANRPAPRVRRRDLAAGWFEHWRLGRWILAGRVVGQLNSGMLLLWMLVPWAGVRAAGVFAACLAIASLSNPLVLGLSTYFAPRIAHAYAREGLRTLRRTVVLTSFLLAPLLAGIVAVTWVVGPWLLRVLYGRAFDGHGELVWMLGAAMAVGSVGIVAGDALVAVERPHRNVAANSLGLLTLAGAAAALIPQWSGTGAALALAAGNLVATVSRWLLLWRLRVDAGAVSETPSVSRDAMPGLAGGRS